MEVVVDDEADELREEDEERIAGRVGMLGEDIVLAHAAGEERLVRVERGLGERVAAADGDDEEEDAEEPPPAARGRGRRGTPGGPCRPRESGGGGVVSSRR